MGFRNAGRRANFAVEGLAARVDDQTGAVAARAAAVIVLAVRVLRWPALALAVLPLPFLLGLLGIGLLADDTWLKVTALVIAGVGGVVAALFLWRRHCIIKATEDERQLATELGIAVAMSDDVGQARDALGELAGGGGVRVFRRLAGLWHAAGVSGDVLTGANDLPLARWFFPPKVGTTVTLFFAVLWLVPLSFLSCLILAIALAAR